LRFVNSLAFPRNRGAGLLAILATACVLVIVLIGMIGSKPESAAGAGEPVGPHKRPLVVFIGNSFTGGSAMDSGGVARYPSLLSARLGFSWMTLTEPGAGYVAHGTDFRRFDDLAAEVPANADVVVILGSNDDAPYPAADIQTRAAETYSRIHQQAPAAEILVVATPWGAHPAPAGILTSRDAVRDAALQDGNAFVDPITERWLVSGPVGQIGSDGLHPTDAGHAEMARQLEPALRTLLAGREERG
jgi:lysophospholipase L1-like esterase